NSSGSTSSLKTDSTSVSVERSTRERSRSSSMTKGSERVPEPRMMRLLIRFVSRGFPVVVRLWVEIRKAARTVFLGVGCVELVKQPRSRLNVFVGFPLEVGVTLPTDKVLKLAGFAVTTRVFDGFDFVEFVFDVNFNRRRRRLDLIDKRIRGGGFQE